MIRRLTAFPGGQGYISVVPQWASIANRFFVKFIASQSHAPTAMRMHDEPIDQRLRRALDFLVELSGDAHLADVKEPLSSMSFSRVPPALQQVQFEHVKMAVRKQKAGWNPLDSEGRPIRRCAYAKRHAHTMF
jgi:hypothetical protein